MLRRAQGLAEKVGIDALLELESLERMLRSGAQRARETSEVLGTALFGDPKTARQKVHAARGRQGRRKK